MRRVLAVTIAALVLTGAAPGDEAAEHLAPPSDASFVLGFVGPNRMREYVPRGETVEKWTRMVTVQTFPYSIGASPAALVRRWVALMERACPGAAGGAIDEAGHDGRVGAATRVTCPRNPATGEPETTAARVVMGDGALHMVQAATRRAPDPVDARWADAVLAGTNFCGAQDRDARCRVDQAIGSPL